MFNEETMSALGLSKLTNSSVYDIVFMIVIVPIIQSLIKFIKNKLSKFKVSSVIKSDYFSEVEYFGTASLDDRGKCKIYFCNFIYAISHKLYSTNKVKIITYIDTDESYILNTEAKNVQIEDDLYLDIRKANKENESEKKTTTFTLTTFVIKSKTKTIEQIVEIINTYVVDYKNFVENKSKNKLFHFVYEGEDSYGESKWTYSVFSDTSSKDTSNFETFEHIFSDNKTLLINEIEHLKDKEFFRRTGLRRKAGFVFYGPPGCGKTSSIGCIANFDNRHILEIPMNRVKTNKQLEKIMNVKEIRGIGLQKNNILMVLEEIDKAFDSLFNFRKNVLSANVLSANVLSLNKDNNSNSVNDETDEKSLNSTLTIGDELNLGTLLSRLDGIGNYDGLFIVATTNHIEKLDSALCRHGRLTPVYFDYASKENILNMIEHFYQISLTSDQKTNIRIEPKTSHSKIIYLLKQHRKSLEDLLKCLI
jgi:hypothetical protein